MINGDNIYEYNIKEERNNEIDYITKGYININDYMNIIHIIGRRINSMILPKEGVYPDVSLIIPKLIYGRDLYELTNPVCNINGEYIKEKVTIEKTDDYLEYIYINKGGLYISLKVGVEREDEYIYCKYKKLYISCSIYIEGKLSPIYEILTQILEPERYIHIDSYLLREKSDTLNEFIDIKEDGYLEVLYPLHAKYINDKKYRELTEEIINNFVYIKDNEYPTPNWVKDIIDILRKEEDIRNRIKMMRYKNIEKEELLSYIKDNKLPIVLDTTYYNKEDIEIYEEDGYWIKEMEGDRVNIIMTLTAQMYTKSHKRYKYITTEKEKIYEGRQNIRDLDDYSLREIEILNLETLIHKLSI